MKADSFNLKVNTPDAELFGEKYSAYKNFVLNEGRFLFELIMKPESFVKAKVATDDFEYPAVAGIANEIRKAALNLGMWEEQSRGYLKQCAGAITCVLMEANGYRKLGKKRSIPAAGWTKGEVYEKV